MLAAQVENNYDVIINHGLSTQVLCAHSTREHGAVFTAVQSDTLVYGPC